MTRTTRSPRGTPVTAAWHLCGVVLVVLVPTLVRLGLPFWQLPERLVPQVPVLALGYIGTVSLASASALRDGSLLPRLVAPVVAGVATFGGGFAFLLYLPGLDYSRMVLLLGFILGLSLTTVPLLVDIRALRWALPALALASAGSLAWAGSETPDTPAPPEPSRAALTALHTIRISIHRDLIKSSPSTGGGLARIADEFILANGEGRFRRLTRDRSGFVSHPLEIPPPLDRDAFLADNSPDIEEDGSFRIMDLEVDTTTSPHRLLASHYHWDRAERCVQIRVSATAIPADGEGPTAGDARWETLFASGGRT